jgi:hypothetical protein
MMGLIRKTEKDSDCQFKSQGDRRTRSHVHGKSDVIYRRM